jgi:hypothetical protein
MMERRPNMRILIVCDLGISRSVTLAGQLKFLGNDVLTCGLKANGGNDPDTFWMLEEWAELIIFTHQDQMDLMSAEPDDRKQLWDMGEDTPETRRPYNPIMLRRAQELVKQHPKIDNRPKTKTKKINPKKINPKKINPKKAIT